LARNDGVALSLAGLALLHAADHEADADAEHRSAQADQQRDP
jgi:hypothetical protein